MPELSFHFGITWQHVEVMPSYELDAYIDALKDIRQSMQQR